jgi:hypothetical protein
MPRLACLPLLALVSCAALQQVAGTGASIPRPDPPRMVVAEVGLAAHPTALIVARALCPRVAPVPVCMVLGGRPSPAELRITFGVALDVENPNTIPLPLVEALVAFTAFPGATGTQNLGAVCISMCDDPAACPPRPDACTAGGPEIRTVNDFAGAAAGFLLAVATGQESVENLRVKTLAPGGTTRVTVQLALDPEQVLALLATLGNESLAAVQRGQVPRFIIPWQVEGSAWVTVERFGKLAAAFGPVQGTWELK